LYAMCLNCGQKTLMMVVGSDYLVRGMD
jgi:hypothetical protein